MKTNTGISVQTKNFNKVKESLEQTPFTFNRLIDTFVKRCANKDYLNKFIQDNIVVK